jgi:hypothetical protein
MRLNPAAFDRHLTQIGQDFLWRRAFTCPCRDPHSGGGKPTCKRCAGVGVFWSDPVPATAGVASQGVVKQFAQFGQWESGDAVFSIPQSSPMFEAGRWDRMLMLNSTDGFSLPLVRGARNERVKLPVEKFERVFWLATDGFTIVEGDLPTVDDAGVLTWLAGAPPEGAQYTITGTRFTEYFVNDMLPSDRGEHHGARLPKRVQARRFDLWGRSSN